MHYCTGTGTETGMNWYLTQNSSMSSILTERAWNDRMIISLLSRSTNSGTAPHCRPIAARLLGYDTIPILKVNGNKPLGFRAAKTIRQANNNTRLTRTVE
eukprot:scaffold30715_cov30-Attheya_sp.AAC.2